MKEYLKKTIIGGVLFLIPMGIIGFILFKLMFIFYQVALVVDKLIPISSVAGIATANILSILLLLLVCFLFGLLATSPKIQFFKNVVEGQILMKIPGYLFIKAYTKGFEEAESNSHELDPVLVRFDDNYQMGFLIDEQPEALSSVYMPGAPNPWSGSVIYVSYDRIKQLNITTRDAIKHLQQAGKNADFVNQ